jgi:hypothetical protein
VTSVGTVTNEAGLSSSIVWGPTAAPRIVVSITKLVTSLAGESRIDHHVQLEEVDVTRNGDPLLRDGADLLQLAADLGGDHEDEPRLTRRGGRGLNRGSKGDLTPRMVISPVMCLAVSNTNGTPSSVAQVADGKVPV